jgi:hypothetical protein
MRAAAFLFVCYSLAFAGTEHFLVINGEVSDSQCAFNVHSNGSSHDDVIRSNVLGHTPEECTRNCVRLGGKYVPVDTVHKKVYHLSNPEIAQPFAAKKVRVKATLAENDVLSIVSIEPQ